MAAIGLHLDKLLSEGCSHFRTAHYLAKSVKTGKLGCQLNRVRQIIKEIRYLKELSNSDQYSFSNTLLLL